MFSNDSRYSDKLVGTNIYTAPDGRQFPYKQRRFCPQGDQIPVQAEHIVGMYDRLDYLAAQALGDPELFWRICDANNCMNPFELTDTPGRVIRIPPPL